jgi:hypothetical protein
MRYLYCKDVIASHILTYPVRSIRGEHAMMNNADFDILPINAWDAWNNSCCYRSRGGDGVKENDGDGGEPHGCFFFCTRFSVFSF